MEKKKKEEREKNNETEASRGDQRDAIVSLFVILPRERENYANTV